MKRVFISFGVEDRNQVNGVRLLAANSKFDIEFYDEFVRKEINSTDAAYVRGKIREKINRTSVTVCMVGPLTHTNEVGQLGAKRTSGQRQREYLMALPGVTGSITLPELICCLKIKCYAWDHDHSGWLIAAAP